jgi:hypothetical protein
MSRIDIREECETEEAANERKQEILDGWPPFGYSTSLRIYQQPTDGKWIVDGYRYSSCD